MAGLSSKTLTIGDPDQPKGYVKVAHVGYNTDSRPLYAWWIKDERGLLLDHRIDLALGARAEPDSAKAMGSLLSFLLASADAYRSELGGRESENSDMFHPDASLWAYMNSELLEAAQLELGAEGIGL